MAVIPVRLPPLPGEALDSWLEAYADLLHVAVRDIFEFAGVGWDRVNGDQRTGKPWLSQLDEPDLAALGAATGVAPETLAGMTLACYQGTGLAEVTAPPGMRRTPRWWRQLSGSRYCPRCLAANGGRWMLSWRIPWVFACAGCQVLLADTCPDCGHRHRKTRTGQPGRCDLAGLPLPPWHPPRGGAPACTSDPAGTPAAALPSGGHVLAAQQHVDAVIGALLASRGQPAEAAVLHQYLDDACAVARAAVSAVSGTAEPPAAAVAVLEELGARTGPGAAASALASRSGGPRRQLAPLTAFGVTIADIMLHGRHDDPDPVIAAWLAGNTASRRNTTSPADVLAHWDQASPALKAALARPLAAQMDTFYQLRYRSVAGPARIPDLTRAEEHAAALPSLMWPGWALRLMPPEGFDFLPGRAALAMMLAIASTGAEDYRTAQEFLGLQPFHPSRLATFAARLREHGILDQVTAALCQLARSLEDNGAPIDYARRRRLRRFSQARLDVTEWRRQRYFLTHPATWAERRHLDHADLPAAPVQEQFARFRLIELLTGTHPRYLPGPLRLPERRSQDYAEFVFTLPGQMARCLHQQARALLAHAAVREPVTWEPPFAWTAGIPWPGPDPDGISPEDLHPLIRAGLPVRAIAARLSASADHVRLAAARHPAPRLPAGHPSPSPAEPEPPGTEQLRDLTSQGYGARKIARITGCSERTIRQLLTSAGLRHPAPPPDGSIDPHWLREHYQHRQRSLKDIAAETGTPVEALAAAARNAGIRVRHGVNGRAHPLAALGGPDAFTADVWNVFTRPGAEQRIRRLLTIPGQPSLQHAARQLGIRTAILTSQVRQLETTVGTALLRTAPDGRLTLTAYGKRFARDVSPVLNTLAEPGATGRASHASYGEVSPRYTRDVDLAPGGWETWSWDESLFAGTARYYEQGRTPYAPGLADAFARSLALDGRGRLLDAGCGPGTVTLPLAPLFEAVVGLDPDPEMLDCATKAAARRGTGNATWIRERAEALPAGLGSFRVVTFAQSFHWMDRPRVAAAVATMLDPGGAVVHVDSRTGELPAETLRASLPFPPPPDEALDQLRRQYLGNDRRAGQGIRNTSPSGEDAVFRQAGFLPAETVTVPDRRAVERTVDDVVAGVFSTSSTAPHLFGDRREEFEKDLRKILAQASPSGRFSARLPDNALRIWRLPA